MDDRPWGTHFCVFYETPDDLVEVNSVYFAAGLRRGEYCVWILSSELDRRTAIEGLAAWVPDLEGRLERDEIEFFVDRDWYLRDGILDVERLLAVWNAKLDEALARGFEGMRVSGNALWMETHPWPRFTDYERELNSWFAGKRAIVLCTYSLCDSRAIDMLDVTRAHQFSAAMRRGRWQFIETPELALANREIARLNNVIDALSTSFPGRRKLTDREQAVLAQIVKGASAKEAARALDISPRTVEFHRRNIMRKLGARNAVDLLTIVLGRR